MDEANTKARSARGTGGGDYVELDSSDEVMDDTPEVSERVPRPSNSRRRATPQDVFIKETYRLERTLEQDAFRVVSEIRHVELGVRLGMVHLTDAANRRSELAQRFVRRARAAAQLRGAHALRVLDFGRLATGSPFIVTEAIEGWSLSEVMRVRGPLPVAEAVDYVMQASAVVNEAQESGLFPLELLPTSLFLTRRPDGSAFVKVRCLDIVETLPAELLQVPEAGAQDFAVRLPYVSPEQIRGSVDPDPRADIWSLGAILFTLLAGEAPFSAATPMGLLASVVADSPKRLRAIRSDCPSGLEETIERCLEKDRTVRYADVTEFVRQLRRFGSLEGFAVAGSVSRPTVTSSVPPPLPVPVNRAIVPVPSPPPSVSAGARQMRTWWGAALIGAIVGSVGAVFAGWSPGQRSAQLPRVDREERREQPVPEVSQVARALRDTASENAAPERSVRAELRLPGAVLPEVKTPEVSVASTVGPLTMPPPPRPVARPSEGRPRDLWTDPSVKKKGASGREAVAKSDPARGLFDDIR